MKISKANKLYQLTAKLIRWASRRLFVLCGEFSVQLVLADNIYARCFAPPAVRSTRLKRTMLAFNSGEFAAINEMCEGETTTHRHDKWGMTADGTQFATSLETAYPMKLARAIALRFVFTLQRLDKKMPPEIFAAGDNAVLPALRAQAGVQPCASKLPPLIPILQQKSHSQVFKLTSCNWM